MSKHSDKSICLNAYSIVTQIKNVPGIEKKNMSGSNTSVTTSRVGSNEPTPVWDGKNSVLIRDDALVALDIINSSGAEVRLALIDPPYNRRTKFHHYSDSLNRDEWTRTISNHCGKIHGILSSDGALWMHIDDAEMPRARIFLDRIFGEANFLGTTVWQKTVSRDNRTPISTTHEYILAYAKNKTEWHKSRNKLPATERQIERYKNKDNDPRGAWASGDLTAKAGPGRRSEQFYDLTLPSGRVVRPACGTCWRYTRERFDELTSQGRIDFGAGNKMPRLKRYLSEVDPGLVPNTWWPGDVVGTADTAKRHLKRLFPDLIPFETPKPEELVSRIIHICTEPDDLVLDIYGGSGTTGAVAHKMGRRWALCEREERTFREFTLPRLQAVIAGKDDGGVSDRFKWKLNQPFQVL